MPTVLRQFPQVSRSGVQQTPYASQPQRFDSFQLTGQADSATLSDTANTIKFEILASPTGSDADSFVLQTEYWNGGTRVNKNTGQTEPNPIDVVFGGDARHADDKLAVRATFGRTMVVGATVTGLP